jgi:hypothetical protein
VTRAEFERLRPLLFSTPTGFPEPLPADPDEGPRDEPGPPAGG